MVGNSGQWRPHEVPYRRSIERLRLSTTGSCKGRSLRRALFSIREQEGSGHVVRKERAPEGNSDEHDSQADAPTTRGIGLHKPYGAAFGNISAVRCTCWREKRSFRNGTSAGDDPNRGSASHQCELVKYCERFRSARHHRGVRRGGLHALVRFVSKRPQVSVRFSR
jgi:hypothetical protein